jgi:hypothetical protein
MGLGYSVEALGTAMFDKDSQHIVKEGLAVAAAYIAIRYVCSSVFKSGRE